jgi:hypothetical protein
MICLYISAPQAKLRQKAGELKFEELTDLHAFEFLLDEASQMQVEALTKGLVAGLGMGTAMAPFADEPAKKKCKTSVGSSQVQASDNSVMALFA